MIHQVASGKIRALYVIGENPAVSEPQSNFVAWMLQRLDLLIVQDIFPIETLKYADIVLPAAMMGEKEGTVTNAARRIQFNFPNTLMEPTEEYPYVLITGRLLEHFNTGEMSRRSTKLTRLRPSSFLDMNPQDAAAAGLSENETVRMTSPYGTVRLPLKLDMSMKPGYLFAPIHFSDPNFNSLMSAVPIDPKARMPALKVIPVKIERDR